MSTAGDINGDGYSDIVLGAPYYERQQAGNMMRARSLPTAGAPAVCWAMEYRPSYACWYDYGTGKCHLGHSVSGAGDVNGDGYADIIAGAPGLGQSDR